MPYQPNISYHGDRYLFEGIASLGQAFGSALRERDARKYQEGLVAKDRKQQEVDLAADEAKKAKATRTFLATWMPEGKDKFETMGLAELEGTARAIAAQQTDKERALRNESLQLNNAAIREAGARRVREDAALRGFLTDVADFSGLAGAANGEPALMLRPELRTQLSQPGGIGLAALARNPDVAPAVSERVVAESVRRPPVPFRPEVLELGDGVKAVRTGPNSVDVLKPGATGQKPTVKVSSKVGTGANAAEVTRELTDEQYAEYVKEQRQAEMRPKIQERLKRRAELRALIATGDRHVGFEAKYLPSFGDRQKELLQVEQELKDLGHADAAEEPAPPSPGIPVGGSETVNGVRIQRTK